MLAKRVSRTSLRSAAEPSKTALVVGGVDAPPPRRFLRANSAVDWRKLRVCWFWCCGCLWRPPAARSCSAERVMRLVLLVVTIAWLQRSPIKKCPVTTDWWKSSHFGLNVSDMDSAGDTTSCSLALTRPDQATLGWRRRRRRRPSTRAAPSATARRVSPRSTGRAACQSSCSRRCAARRATGRSLSVSPR